MKNLKKLGMILIAIIACISMITCSNESESLTNEDEQEVYTIQLGWGGELDVRYEPLSRENSNNDLYGIQVYSSLKDDNSQTYSPYAYGLFNDASSISIKLIDGYKYKFVATMVVNGKNIIKNYIKGDKTEYNYPFIWSGGNTKGGGIIDTLFKYSTKESFTNLNKGTTNLVIDNQTYHIPNTDRYYGEVTDFIPQKNQSVTINMKRVVFGLKIISENLEDGSLIVSLKDAPQMNIVSPITTMESLYTFNNLTKAYSSENYSETIEVAFVWQKTDNTNMPIASHHIEFKRNKLTTITIKVSDNSKEQSLGIILDNDQITPGDNLTIENGEIIDTPINTPTE